MKKNYKYRAWYDHAFKKTFLVMRLVFVISLVCIMQSFALDSYTQNSKISISVKEMKLDDILMKIENETNYRFAYNKTDIDVDQVYTIDISDGQIKEVLDKLFTDKAISYKIIDQRQIILSRSSSSYTVSQQPKSISGRVTDSSGQRLPGVSVVIKSTTTGTITDTDGKYFLPNVPSDAILVFSFVGMKMQEIAVSGKTTIDLVMQEETVNVDEVVVTALGIEKNEKYLTYSTQNVGGEELTKVVDPNLMNTISGKIAGISINQTSGVGGSVKVNIRGERSFQRGNSPLFVIDGMPMSCGGSQSTNGLGSSWDRGGDGISNLNPQDIESINVLKGASAAALYGSSAANGVILITTKKGKAGETKVNFSSTFTMDNTLYLAKLQNSYGQTAPGSEESWGDPVSSAPDNTSDFFKTGTNYVNTLSFSSGNQKMQTYLSYSNTSSRGIQEDNKLCRHNLSLRQSANFFDDKLTADARVTLVKQEVNNPPVAGYQISTYASLLGIPVGIDLADYRDYEKLDANRNLMTQNWFIEPVTTSSQNPYWIMNRMLREFDHTRAMVKLSLKYNITDWMNIQVRGNMEKSFKTEQLKYYYGTARAYGFDNGHYSLSRSESTQYYADALLNVSYLKNEKVKINALLGASISDPHSSSMTAGTIKLKIPNVFTLNNMQMVSGTSLDSGLGHQQEQSVFGSANLVYDDWLVLDVTGRNDWSSTLSYTPNVSYFYPSCGLTGLVHQLITLPKIISFAKVRASYAVVGNSVPSYVTNPSLGYIVNGETINFNNTAPFSELEPEKTKSMEFGADLRFLDNQFSIDFTYYKTNTTNQFFTVEVPPGTGYNYRYVNGGNIQNSGIELTVGYSSLPGKNLQWESFINFSTNKNLVKELYEEFEQFVLADDLAAGYRRILTVGGSFGDFYAQSLKRDDLGRVIINADGSPISSGSNDFIGNSSPDFKLGWGNSFSYRGFSLSFLIDGKFGGKMMSLTEMKLDEIGKSKASGEARDNGGVQVNGVLEGTDTPVTSVDPHKWYTVKSKHMLGEYMYDATMIKLRELSIGYSVPVRRWNMGPVKELNLSLIGRNLFYFYKPAPWDSDFTYTTKESYVGVDYFSLPATRTLGIRLNVTF